MLEHPAGLSAQEEEVWCSAGPPVVAQGLLAHGHAGMPGHTDTQGCRTHRQTCTRAHSGCHLLSQKDSSLELVLGHKSSESLKSELEWNLLFTALLLVGNEDKLFYTAFSGTGV